MATTNFEAAHAAVVAALRGIAQCTVGPGAPIAPSSAAWAPDFFVELTGPWGARRLACRIEAALHPKKAHGCQLAFADWLRHTPSQDVYPVLLAPFVSEASSLLLAQSKVGFMDSAGNALLDLPGVYLDRRVPGNVKRERNAVRPLFTPAAARVLRVLLTTAGPWKVQPLSEAARVSPGHVSHVRRMLCDYRWATAGSGGLQVVRPEEILDAWRKTGNPALPLKRGYTPLHGAALAAKLSELMATDKGGNLLLAGASAANYFAPYLRTSVTELRATSAGLNQLREKLLWRDVSEGANVLVELADTPEGFAGKAQPAADVFSTDPITTYLALCRRGDRHADAAEHLRLTLLLPQWRNLCLSSNGASTNMLEP